MLEPPPGRYMMLPDLDSVLAMSLAASMRRSSIKPGPALLVASEIKRADSLSPSALMTAAIRSCISAHSTFSNHKNRPSAMKLPMDFDKETSERLASFTSNLMKMNVDDANRAVRARLWTVCCNVFLV